MPLSHNSKAFNSFLKIETVFSDHFSVVEAVELLQIRLWVKETSHTHTHTMFLRLTRNVDSEKSTARASAGPSAQFPWH